MADYEQRPRGGRGGGNYNNRKRRYRDDDDQDRRGSRRRYEEPPATRIRKQLLGLADSPLKRVEDEIVSIARTVAEGYDDAYLRHSFYELALACVEEQPVRIPFIAAVVVAGNARRADVGADLVPQVAARLEDALRAADWRAVKLWLRFLAGLQGCLEADGVWAPLQDLLTRAVELQTADAEETLGPEIVKIILLTIPYIVTSSASDTTQSATALLANTDIIASEPHALQALVDPFYGDGKTDAPALKGVLPLLQQQLQRESENGWELACLPRPWKGSETEGQEDALATAVKHPLPPINLPETLNAGLNLIFPELYFSVYADQDVETVPPTTDIASILVRDAILDTINVLDYNRNATSRFLIDIDCYFAQGTFVKRATPFDRLRDVAGDRSTWKPEDVAVDAVFSQLFQLPMPQHKLVYYHSVLTESCKIAPAAIAPSLGRAIRFLYRHVGTMDLELSYRFMDWFSHHLSNFGFTWKWTEWVEDVELPDLDPRKAFIRGALDKEIRLSFAQRIKGTLPAPYQALISVEKEKDSPEYKFDDPSTPFATQALEILAAIRRKTTAEDLATLIAAVQTTAETDHAHPTPLLPAIDCFVTSLCHVGSKSTSHMLSCIERNKETLSNLSASGIAARKQIIESVMAYWTYHPGTGVNLVRKLLGYLIVTPSSVVEWCIGTRGSNLGQPWCFELISATLEKASTHARAAVEGEVSGIASTDGADTVMDGTSDTTKSILQGRHELSTLIIDLLSSWADGTKDESLQPEDAIVDDGAESSAATTANATYIRRWGARWLRVFRRGTALQDAWCLPAAVEARVQARRARADIESQRTEREARVREAKAAAKGMIGGGRARARDTTGAGAMNGVDTNGAAIGGSGDATADMAAAAAAAAATMPIGPGEEEVGFEEAM